MKKFKLLLVILSVFLMLSVACNKQNADTTTNGQNSISIVETPDQQQVESSKIDFNTAIIIIVVIVIVVAFSFFFFKNIFPVGLWFKAWTAGVRVGVRSFFNMYFQKIPPEPIINNMITAKKAGVSLKVRQLENYYLANIDLDKIVQSQIEAHNANVPITIDQLANAYLAKIDIEKITEALILVQSADINTNFEELKQLYLTGADIVKVVKSKIEAKNSGYPIEFQDLAEHYLAGGDLDKTIDAYVAARKADLKDFDFGDIADLDLAGYDVFEIVQKAIIPRVVEGDRVRGVARDGVELSMKVKVTIRAKLKHIIGNPEESTILARINEGLATEIGLAESHYHVLENPYELADKVEQKGLDINTAFEVLSIDVSDITIGKDVHAELKSERAKAEADKARADLLKADEKLKKAMAAAFLEGNISVHEYEKLMNLQADTKMRLNLSMQDNDENNDENNNDDDEHHNNDEHND
jgi:uncharacterized protein YqfA (UPF0365 family)